jgi:outer membrane protein assembly factor BamB
MGHQPTALSAKKPLFPPWLRLAVACLVTLAILPYAAARTIAMTMMVGAPEMLFLSLLVAGVIAVMGLTAGLAASFPGRVVRSIIGAIFVLWVAIIGVLIVLFNGDLLPWPLVWLVFVPATLWAPWLAWIFFPPARWPRPVVVLLGLGLVAAASVAMLRVDGLSGAARVNFTWRWTASAQARWEESETRGLADLTPSDHDYPQFLGPLRLAVAPQARLRPDWNSTPPREIWRRPVGAGWSAFAIVGLFAITQEQRDENECACCYRLDDGQPVWTHQDTVCFDGKLGGGPGPRATPTVANGKVYTVGATGLLNCLDGATGRRLWSVDILQDNQGENVAHGVCASPLLIDDLVIVCPTGQNGLSLAAYERHTGKRMWQAGKHQASYSSPVLTTIHDVPQVLLFTSEGLDGHDPRTGQLLWSFPWTNSVKVNVSQPVRIPATSGDLVVATGYDTGSARVRVTRSAGDTWSATAVWENRKPLMQAKFTTPVFHQGFIYGLDNGILACLDPETGKRLWHDGRFGHGQILLAGSLLLVQAEDGRVALVEPNPESLRLLARLPALDGKTWNNPALAGEYLLVRNDREAVCYRLPLSGD